MRMSDIYFDFVQRGIKAVTVGVPGGYGHHSFEGCASPSNTANVRLRS